MLHKQRSTRTAILKYGLFLPLFAITLMLSSATIRSNETIIAVTKEIPLNEPLATVEEVITAPIKASTNLKTTTIDPKDPAWQNFYKFFKMKIHYPAQAQENGLQGNTLIKFTIKDGEASNISILNKLGLGCDAEVMKLLISYEGFTAAQNGNYTFPVQFRLSDSKTPLKNPTLAAVSGYTRLAPVVVTGFGGRKQAMSQSTNTIDMSKVGNDPNDTKVYDFVSIERQPSFPGSMEAFYHFLRSNVKYPKEAMDKNVQGKVFLSFIVEKDGSLVDIKVERKLGSGTDEEAVRVLKASPKWIPGINDNKAVRVKYNIPISFSLSSPAPQTGQIKTNLKNSDLSLASLGFNSDKEPLLYINGKKSAQKLADMNPDNIKSLTILKDDASTKLYGPEAANGVILITNKEEQKN